MLRLLRVCDRQKEKGSEIDASPQLPISTGVQSLDRSRVPWSVPLDQSRLPRSAIMAAQVQSTDVFLCYQRLVRCATISRQLGQGRQRSGGSSLFMINHRSSNYYLYFSYAEIYSPHILTCTSVSCDNSLVPSLLTRRAPLSIAAAQKREPGTLCTCMREFNN